MSRRNDDDQRKGWSMPQNDEPLDDALMQTESTISSIETLLSSYESNDLVSWTKGRIQAVDRIEATLLNDCNRVKNMLEGTRDKIRAELHSRKNLNGCLTGAVDDYLCSFDAEIEKLRKRIAVSRCQWHKKVE